MLDFISKISAPLRPEAYTRGTTEPEAVDAHLPVAEPSPLAGMRFRYPMRKYQEEILELTRLKLARGERALHIVAPPGAGKTIIGLQLVCQLQEPALIISPTTTIQAQWGEKLGLFLPPDATDTSTAHLLGTHEDKPLKPITLLTYQVLSTTSKEQEYLEKLAHKAWVDELVSGTVNSMGAAELRILDLMQNNKKAYDREISRHVTRLRRKLTHLLDLKEVLHPNAISLIQALRRQKFKVVIFDECHHLTDYWAAIMAQVVNKLDAPLVIGLTGTPPEGKSAGQETRYMQLVGDIDYQVPTPALVREGGLAPFQDLVLFTRPTENEEQFLALQHHAFHDLALELTQQADIGAARALAKVEQRTGISPQSVLLKQLATKAKLEAQAKTVTPKQETTSTAAIPPSAEQSCAPTAEQSCASAAQLNSEQPEWSDDGGDIINGDFDFVDDAPLFAASPATSSAAEQVGTSQQPNTAPQATTTLPPITAPSGRSELAPSTTASAPPALAAPLPDKASAKPPQERHSLLSRWVSERITSAGNDGWDKFMAKEANLAAAMCRYAWKFHLKLPEEVELSNDLMQAPLFIDDWMIILEDFSLNYLKVSASPENHELYERIRHAIAKLGYGLTEKGLRKQASPVDRVLAFSRSKTRAVAEILQIEHQNLQDRLRAVVVTDFEKMSATATKSAKGVLTEESGGAIAVLKDLLSDQIAAEVNPCLVTGSIILVDNRIAQSFLQGINDLLKEEGYTFAAEISPVPGENFSQLSSNSSQWESRIYVGLATRLLERGISKVLVGTRGIFGEGWDCQALNTLVDLTTTTTPMSVKQLRGRSIRINTADPLGACKVANNWDVVCIAPHLEKGLNDYHRFVRKHEGFFGVCDDGQVECGVGHVHPSFSELTPAEVFAGLDGFNNQMKERALKRSSIYDLWKVGQHYSNVTIGCAEVTKMRTLHLTPPYLRKSLSYHEHSQLLRQNLSGIWFDYAAAGLLIAIPTGLTAVYLHWHSFIPAIPLFLAFVLAIRRYMLLYRRIKMETCRPCTQESSLRDIGIAILRALQKLKVIPRIVPIEAVRVTRRSDGSLRIFLDTADPKHAQEFIKCVKETIEPIKAQPFLISKFEFAPLLESKIAKKKRVTDATVSKLTNKATGRGKGKTSPKALSQQPSATPKSKAKTSKASVSTKNEKNKQQLLT